MLDRGSSPWAGQLYISHTGEATCKLLYKKFFRKTDCTILHGPWKQILLEQQKAYYNDLPSPGIRYLIYLSRILTYLISYTQGITVLTTQHFQQPTTQQLRFCWDRQHWILYAPSRSSAPFILCFECGPHPSFHTFWRSSRTPPSPCNPADSFT